MRRAQVDDDEGGPDDASGIHGEADVLALVERLRDLAGQEGVHRAHDHQQDRVGKPDHVGKPHCLLTHQLVIGAVGVKRNSQGRRHQQPDQAEDDLPSHHRAADDELGLRTDELGPLGRALARAEDASDAVGFGQDGGVADGETQAQTNLLRPAGHVGRLGHQQEGHTVAHQNPEEQDEAELSARGLHHRGVLVAQEEHADEAGGQDPERGEGHGRQSDGVRVLEVDLRDGDARGHVVAGHCSVWALLAPGHAQGGVG